MFIVTMDNPNNFLITKQQVEDILNNFGNIGQNGCRLEIDNLEYFQRAFVHESYYQSVQNAIINGQIDDNKICMKYIPSQSNERLEYLGDHILKSIMGRYLYERFGDEREGFLTRLKIKIEKCSMLHKIGVTLGFRKYLLLSLQVENQTILDYDRGRGTPSYYEDAFEAFVGSIVLEFGEQGYIYADRFVRNVIEHIIDFAELISKNDNFKDSLQRYFQSMKWKTPVYIGLVEEGPLYRKVFTRMLVISKDQVSQLDPQIQNNIDLYTRKTLEYFKLRNTEVFSTLFKLYDSGQLILGLGYGRKVTSAEQDCAKNCLTMFELDLNY
jgi:dsRNA-specific ribonuclease